MGVLGGYLTYGLFITDFQHITFCTLKFSTLHYVTTHLR